MDERNELRYLISSEGGATALLATALDRDLASSWAGQRHFRKAFARACSIALSDRGPRYLALEQYGFDLFAMWDEWAMVVEAKIASGSVRPGQLGELYERATDLLKRGKFPGASRILMVFVAPLGVGHGEFTSLTVCDDHVKAHVEWETIITDLETAPRTDVRGAGSFLSELMIRGAKHLTNLIQGKKRGVVEWTPERRRCQEFARSVQEAVKHEWRGTTLHLNPQWAGPSVDEIYANFGGAPSGNVYFQVDSESDIAENENEPSTLRGRVRFRVANKARRGKRAAFMQFPDPTFPDKLEISQQERNILTRDDKALQFTWEIEWRGSRDHLTQRGTRAFSSFLHTFRPLMIRDTG